MSKTRNERKRQKERVLLVLTVVAWAVAIFMLLTLKAV